MAQAAEVRGTDFEAVFHAHYERIARAIYRIVNAPARAEELAVEVFWKFWRTPRAHGEKAGGWLFRAAVRLALTELRRQVREAPQPGTERRSRACYPI